MRRDLPQGLFVKLSCAAAFVWILVGARALPVMGMGGANVADLLEVLSVLVFHAVLIVGLGLASQSVYHFTLARTRKRRLGDLRRRHGPSRDLSVGREPR